VQNIVAFLSSPLMHKNEYRPPDRSRKQRFLTEDDVKKGKKSKWTELEITGELFIIFFCLKRLFRTRACPEPSTVESSSPYCSLFE
jgi:hypothetical protein